MSSSVQWPLRTVTQFVCRESLGESLPHVVDLIGNFLDDFLPQQAFTEACRRGAATNTLEYFLEWTAPDWQKAVDAAARSGHLHVFEWMMKKRSEHRGPWVVDFGYALEDASSSNHFELVEWLLDCKTLGRLPVYDGMHHAAENGNLEIVQLLQKHRPDSLSDNIFDIAASQGHFEVVQWIHLNYPTSSSRFTLHAAAKNGRLDMVQWLWQNGYDACREEAMDGALKGGHLHIAQWLFDHGGKCSQSGPVSAAKQGNLEELRWLHEHFTDRFTPKVMDAAAEYNHLHVIKWLHKYRTEGCTTDAMDMAAARGHINVLQWLHANRHEGCSTEAMYYAAERGQLDSIRWLHENRSEGCGSSALNFAAMNGHLEVVRYLHEHGLDKCSSFGMYESITHGRYEMVRYLYDSNVCRSYGPAMRSAVDRGCFEIMKVLLQITDRSWCTISGGYVVDKWANEMFTLALQDRSAQGERLDNIHQQLEWFNDHEYYGCVSRTLELALKSGHICVVQRFFEHDGQAKCAKLFAETRCRGNLLRWQLENGLQIDLDTARKLINSDRIEIIWWIAENHRVTIVCEALQGSLDKWQDVLLWIADSRIRFEKESRRAIGDALHQAPTWVTNTSGFKAFVLMFGSSLAASTV